MGRSLLIAAAMLALVGPAQAATHSVGVSSNNFSPAHREIPAGDTVLWVWSQGPHNVTAFAGASFASGNRSANATYTQTFGGGVVKYRCTLHSTLIGGECDGMCGLLTENQADYTQPDITIDRPSQGQIVAPTPRLQGGVVNPVSVEGEANDNVGILGVLLRLYDTTGGSDEFVANCIGCTDASVQWKIELNLLPGSYVAEARAADTSGNVRWSARTSFSVL